MKAINIFLGIIGVVNMVFAMILFWLTVKNYYRLDLRLILLIILGIVYLYTNGLSLLNIVEDELNGQKLKCDA